MAKGNEWTSEKRSALLQCLSSYLSRKETVLGGEIVDEDQQGFLE